MEWRLMSGERVVDRPRSHVRSDARPHIGAALAGIDAGGRDFFVEEVDFGLPIGETICVETTDLDEVIYAQRVNRSTVTRFVKSRQPEPCSTLVVILKKGDDGYILITSYIGEKSDPEPNAGHATAPTGYWANHALIWGAEEIIPGTERRLGECVATSPRGERRLEEAKGARLALMLFAAGNPHGGIEFETNTGEKLLLLASRLNRGRGTAYFKLCPDLLTSRNRRRMISEELFIEATMRTCTVRVFSTAAATPRTVSSFSELIVNIESWRDPRVVDSFTGRAEVPQSGGGCLEGDSASCDRSLYGQLAMKSFHAALDTFPYASESCCYAFANVVVEVCHGLTGPYSASHTRQETGVKQYGWLRGMDPEVIITEILAEETRWDGPIFGDWVKDRDE